MIAATGKAQSRAKRWLGGTLATLALAMLAGGITVLWAQTTTGQGLVADLSSHLIAITTGFTGSDVVLFGATDGPGDVAVVVTGPRGPVTVRRKERVAGMWMNRSAVTFERVPSYYAVASNRPLESLAQTRVLARNGLDMTQLPLATAESTLTPDTVTPFREALIQEKRRDGFYSRGDGHVVFLGERLFRTTISFPANVATGAYTVGVFLIRDRNIVSAQTTPLIVSKTGLSAEISEFAQRQPVLYGLLAIAGALAIGWLAGSILGRL